MRGANNLIFTEGTSKYQSSNNMEYIDSKIMDIASEEDLSINILRSSQKLLLSQIGILKNEQ
jgi:hypothetical protein